MKPNAAIEQSKRKLAAQLARIHSRRAAALSRVNAHYDDIEQEWYATVPPEWHVAIREAATRSIVGVVILEDGKKIVREG